MHAVEATRIDLWDEQEIKCQHGDELGELQSGGQHRPSPRPSATSRRLLKRSKLLYLQRAALAAQPSWLDEHTDLSLLSITGLCAFTLQPRHPLAGLCQAHTDMKCRRGKRPGIDS